MPRARTIPGAAPWWVSPMSGRFAMTHVETSPNGAANPQAQGNALGLGGTATQALKGRNPLPALWVPPFQDSESVKLPYSQGVALGFGITAPSGLQANAPSRVRCGLRSCERSATVFAVRTRSLRSHTQVATAMSSSRMPPVTRHIMCHAGPLPRGCGANSISTPGAAATFS